MGQVRLESLRTRSLPGALIHQLRMGLRTQKHRVQLMPAAPEQVRAHEEARWHLRKKSGRGGQHGGVMYMLYNGFNNNMQKCKSTGGCRGVAYHQADDWHSPRWHRVWVSWVHVARPVSLEGMGRKTTFPTQQLRHAVQGKTPARKVRCVQLPDRAITGERDEFCINQQSGMPDERGPRLFSSLAQ